MNNLMDYDIPYERLEASTPPESLNSLIEGMFSGSSNERLSAARIASKAWSEANGDRERTHTTGVTLIPPKGNAADPRMVVYVDSNVLLSDFRTNTDLYLGRLANWGLALSGLDFRLSHDVERHWHSSSVQEDILPELSDDTQQWLDKMVEELPGELRPKVRAAAESSLRRNL